MEWWNAQKVQHKKLELPPPSPPATRALSSAELQIDEAAAETKPQHRRSRSRGQSRSRAKAAAVCAFKRRRSSSPSDLPPPLPPLPPSLTATAAAAEAAETASQCVVCEAPEAEAPAEAESPAEGAHVRSAADPHLPSPLPPLPPSASLIEDAATAAAVVCEAPKAPAEAEAPAEDTDRTQNALCLVETDYFTSSSDSEEEVRTMDDNRLFTVFLAAAKEIRSRGFDPKRFVI